MSERMLNVAKKEKKRETGKEGRETQTLETHI